MKTEIENSIRRLSFLCHLPVIKTAWINPWLVVQIVKNKIQHKDIIE